MKLAALVSLFALAVAALCQGDVSLMSNAEIGEKIRTLAPGGKATYDEQVTLTWALLVRSVQGDADAHKIGKTPAERLAKENDMNFRAKFAFGYFRIMEAYDTKDPVTRKRRVDEGRRSLTTAIPMGSRDNSFLFDGGMVLAGMRTELDLFRSAANMLTLARRNMGANFDTLGKDRIADWYCAMGRALDTAGIEEMARDNYKKAYDTSPESASGRKAISWLRSHGN